MLPKLAGTASTEKQSESKAPAPLFGEMPTPQGFMPVVPRPMKQWDTPGEKVMAYFLDVRPSTKFVGRSVVNLVDDNGVIDTWACPDMLEQCLRGIARKTVVCIHYRGEKLNNPADASKGVTKFFQVFIGGA